MASITYSDDQYADNTGIANAAEYAKAHNQAARARAGAGVACRE